MSIPTDAPTDSLGRALRHDGWTPERQACFLRLIAEGHTTVDACRQVGLSPSGAYALRDRAPRFALGWAAANLRAREPIADALLARAIHGQVEWRTGRDGERVERFRYDNGLASRMLARLDAQADPAGPDGHRAARAAAQRFDACCDAIEHDADAADPLDLDARATWTAEQWRRAEATGLVAVAPAYGAPDRPLVDDDPDRAADGRIWRDEHRGDWQTDFAPPPGFTGWQQGEWGDDDYARELTDEEHELAERPGRAERRAALAADRAEREQWLAAAVTLAPDEPAPDPAGDDPFDDDDDELPTSFAMARDMAPAPGPVEDVARDDEGLPAGFTMTPDGPRPIRTYVVPGFMPPGAAGPTVWTV